MLDKASLIFICVLYQRLYGVSNMVISIIIVVIIINASSIIIIVAIISLGFNLIFISCMGPFRSLAMKDLFHACMYLTVMRVCVLRDVALN